MLMVERGTQKKHTRNVQLGAAVEQTESAFFQAAREETSKESLGVVDGVTGLVNLVAAAEVEVGAAGVAGLADGDITGDRGETVAAPRGAAELRHGDGAEGEGEGGGNGELHLD